MTQVNICNDIQEYLTIGEAATYIGVSPWTLRNWDKAGKLTATRHPKNGYRIYRREDLGALRPFANRRREANAKLAPSSGNWTEMGEADHFVQFYESDTFLMDSVAGFMGAALAAGDGGVVIATEPHRQALRDALKAQGLDLDTAMAQGRFVSLDAAETLSKFMVDGSPDAERFSEVVGSVVKRVARPERRLRAFGEMVALLWAEGNRAAAIRLEELWNDLAKINTFALFCAYPLNGFADDKSGEPFVDICSCHTRVIPAESYSTLGTPHERDRAITRLQQRAQALEAEIAHRTEVEKSLAHREQELSDFLENAVEGLHQVGPDGKIMWANRAELNLLGYSREEYIGRHISEFHADRAVIDGMLDRLVRGETLRDYPARLRCKDGTVKHVLVNSNGCFSGGKFVYTRCFTRDITERKQAEQVNARLAAIVNSSDDAIIGKTLEGVITSWNEGASKIFGYSAAEAVGRSILFLMPADRRDEEKSILASLRRRERIDHFETQRLTKDGRIIDVSLTISPICDGEGRIIGASKIARDITERKKLDRAISEINETLERRITEGTAVAEEQSDRARELASQLAQAERRERKKLGALLHDELAQSLALGKLRLTILEAQPPEARDDAALAAIGETLSAAIQFTRSLMNDLSPPMLYDMGFSAAVNELASRMKEQNGLTVAVNASGKVTIPDSLRAFLFQSVREMLINIAKYGSTDRATVTIVKKPSLISVAVEDQGAGFDLHTLPARPSGEGGFGLFNIREQADLLGGSFHIESRPGQGTRCRLEVPIRNDAHLDQKHENQVSASGKQNQSPAAAQAARDGKTRVMLVDDHAAIRDGLTMVLRGFADMEVVGQAADGPQAIELARQLKPHVILLDISLPGMDGIETTRRLRGEVPQAKVIGLSMHNKDEGARICQAGAVTFLSKDCSRDVLVETIRKYVQ